MDREVLQRPGKRIHDTREKLAQDWEFRYHFQLSCRKRIINSPHRLSSHYAFNELETKCEK